MSFGTADICYGVVVILVINLIKSIYNFLTNPLRKVPGPWYSAWTRKVVQYHVLKGRKATYIHTLHLKYGPVVRIHPTEVDFSDLGAAQKIHSVKNAFLKSDMYKKMSIPGAPNVFTVQDPLIHRRQRRLLSSPMSESGLKVFIPTIDEKTRLWIKCVGNEMKEHGAADVFKWSTYLTTDIIGDLAFGESFHMLETGQPHRYLRDLGGPTVFIAIRNMFPFVRKLVEWGVPVPGAAYARRRIERITDAAAERLETHRRLQENSESVKSTLFTKIHAAGEKDQLSTEEIVSNAQLYIVAGSDTTANTLTYLIWAVCQRANVKEKLLDELRTLPDPLSYEDLRDLPYLNSVIEETLRLWPPVPSPLPRVVPSKGVELAGHFIPGGTIVSTQAYSFHRDPEIFPNAELFNPSRWQKATKTMRDASFGFGAGSRVCLGLYLALMELRLATTRFFLAFPDARVSQLEGMCDADMEIREFFLASPRGRRCLIQTS